MRALWIGIGAALLAGCATITEERPSVASSTTQETKLRQMGAAVLFWSGRERVENFPAMEKLFPGQVVKAGGRVRTLTDGRPLDLSPEIVDNFIKSQNAAGLIVVQDGRILLERYALGYSRTGRWTSFSVAKSVTSTLVGAAVRDGYIKSLDDAVTTYIPELAGGGYDGVTIRQILTMTSGVRWNEDYTDPKSDVARLVSQPTTPGVDPTVGYMSKLPRAYPPGSKFVYKTGETNLIGVLVQRATGKGLAEYLSEKIWRPYGMERDAFWMSDAMGHEIGGCCLSMSLRDYARIGMLTIEGGRGIVPAGWFKEATRAHTTFPGGGYGYQWWINDRGGYAAIGIFGQAIIVQPEAKLVIAISGAWPKADDDSLSEAQSEFAGRVLDSVTKQAK